jgi:RNA polymerase-binding transcription factor DksA
MDPNSPEAGDASVVLQAERARVEAIISSVRRELDQDGPISRTIEAAADTTTEQANLELLRELEAELDEIDAAIARVAAGTYGIDEVTGEPIDPERLRAVPTARTNI